MTQMIRYLILNLLGLALAAFGAYAAVNTSPSSTQFAAWARAMPTLGAMLAFGVSVAAVIVGLILLVPLLWRLRRRTAPAPYGSIHAYGRVPAPRPVPVQHDDDEYEPETAGCGSGGYAGDRHGTGYFDGRDDRFSGNGDHRQFDDRRRLSVYR